jgi:hypothetical protein
VGFVPRAAVYRSPRLDDTSSRPCLRSTPP